MEVASVKYFDQFEKEQCSDPKKAVLNQKLRKKSKIKVSNRQTTLVMLLTTHHHSVDGIISNSMWPNSTPTWQSQTVKHSNPESCLIHGFHSNFCIKMKLQ